MVQPPFELDFASMSERQLSQYAHWFSAVQDERMLEIETAVQTTPGFESWSATCTRESLGPLGEWFVNAVTTRPFTSDELAQITVRGHLIAPEDDAQLTDSSLSIAFDIGLYLARTFERNYPQLRWKQFLDDKRFIDYGQPVLTGFGHIPLNPIQVTSNIAYRIASGKESGQCLLEVYDHWARKVVPRGH